MSTLPFRRRPLIEELEPRLLFSADLAPLAFEPLAPISEQRVINPSGEFSAPAVEQQRELVIVDSGVENHQTLIDDILNQRGSRQIEIVLLDASRDGVEQISEILGQRSGLDAVHLISHGGAGFLQLGGQVLNADVLYKQTPLIQAWGAALSPEADILLYGCDVAAGEAGETFIKALSQLTGADIAASSDKTGNEANADWALEMQQGSIETRLLLGEIHAAWQGTLDIDPAATQALASVVSPHNQSTTPSARQVAINPNDGSFAVVWTSQNQDGSGNGIYLRRFDATGNPISATETQVNTTTAGNQQAPSIAMDANGNFVVVWESLNQDGSGYGIYAKRFDAAGVALDAAEFRVNTTSTNDQINPSVSMDAAGNFVVAWQSANEDGDGWGIYTQRFNADGTKNGSQIEINSTTRDDQTQPAVAMNDTGAFVVVWRTSDNNEIHGRLFNAAGATVKNEFVINPYSSTTSDRGQPDVVMNANGEFYVAYGYETSAGIDLWAVGFNAVGDRIGFGVFVNQYYSGAQLVPSIALDDTGGFIVAWQSDGQDGSGTAVVARHFKSNYSAYESETVLNLSTSGSQSAPSVAFQNGKAVFVWSGNGAEDSQGIYFRQATVSQTNILPTITSNGGGASATLSIAENISLVTTVTATDDGMAALVYTLSGGADAGLFTIDSVTGVLRFINPPDYDAPSDTNRDNVYEVAVSVADDRGGTDNQTLLIAVTNVNEAPLASANTYSLSQNSVLIISAAEGVLSNDSDPDRDPLTPILLSTTTNGTLVLGLDGSLIYSPNAGFSGSDSFTYRAFDGSLYSNPVTVILNVNAVNYAPTTTPVTLAPAVLEEASRLITETELLAGAADANNDPLSVSALSIVSGGGQLVNNGNSTWTYTPALNDDTSVSFSYTVSDGGQSTSGTATLDIEAVNDAPEGVNDTLVTDEDTPLTLAVTSNDTDQENQTLSVTAVTQSTNGSVTFAGGTLTYTPNPDFFGDDNFTYTVTDSDSASDTAIVYVTVTPLNDTPTVANPISDQPATEDAAFSFQFPNNTFYDVDVGDSLTYTVLGLPSWLSFDATTRTFSGTPANDNIGITTLTVRATDASGQWAEDLFNVVVSNTNDAPVLASIGNRIVNEGAPLTFTASASDIDVPANTLTYSLSGAPTGASIDAATGAFSWTPTEAQGAGVYSFDVIVSDGAGGSDSETLSITVREVNAAPTGTDNTLSTPEDTAYVFAATDFGFADPNDTPADSLLAVKINTLPGAGNLTLNGMTVSAGQSISVADINAALLRFTPAADSNGTGYASFSFQVQDSGATANGGVDLDPTPNTITINVTPVNDAPLANPDSVTGNEDTPISGNVLTNDTDLDSASLTAVLVSGTANGSLVLNADGSFTYTPNAHFNGSDSFTYQANDGALDSAPATVTLTVNAIYDAPTTAPVTLAPLAEDSGSRLITQAVLLVNAGDADGDALTATSLSITSGTGSLINNGNGTWTYTPALNDDTAAGFSYSVTDGSLNASGSATMDLTPVNDAPVFTSTAPTTATEDTVYSTLIVAADPDGGTRLQFTASTLPAWLTRVDHGNGTATLSGTPTNADTGSHTLVISVSDGSLSATQSFLLTVNNTNDAPTLVTNNLDTTPGATSTVTGAHLQATDVDHTASELRYVLDSQPTQGTLALNGVALAAGGSFTQDDLDTGRVSYTATATASAADAISLRVVDLAGASVAGAFSVQVTAPAPIVAQVAAPMPVPPQSESQTEPQSEPNEAGAPAADAALPTALAPVTTHVAMPTPQSGDSVSPLTEVNAPSSNTVAVATPPSPAALSSNQPTAASPLLTPLGLILNAMNSEIRALESLNLSLGNDNFQQQLDQIQNEIRQQLSLDKNTVASSLAVSTGLSVGYVLWLVRGGVLLSSLLSTLPAWRLIDPLPILGSLKRRGEQDDDDSLEGLLKKSTVDSETRPAGEKND